MRETKDLARLHRVGGAAALVERQGRPRPASPTTPPTSGASPACNRRIWPPSASGRATPTATATPPITAASHHVPEELAGRCRSRPCSTAVGTRGAKSRVTGELVCGPETLAEEELAKNSRQLGDELLDHPLDGAYYRESRPIFDKIKVPLLSCGNWGGQGLHLRGNVEGFVRAASKDKWLELHGGSHWALFYTDYGDALQRRFFDHYLKGEKNGWDKQPKVQLNVRHPGEKFVVRHENEWPIARTNGPNFISIPTAMSFAPTAAAEQAATKAFQATGRWSTFRPSRCSRRPRSPGRWRPSCWVSSSTSDADLFLVFRVFDPAGKEVLFQGALDPHTPVAQGWLRASHRKLDPKLSTALPALSHARREAAGDAGRGLRTRRRDLADLHRRAEGLTHRRSPCAASDYENGLARPATLSNMKNPMKGCGPFVHDDPDDRPAAVFGGTTTLHFAPGMPAYVLVPVVPKKA